MPRNLPINIIAAKNELNQSDPWLAFVDVTMPDDSVVHIVNDTENVTWNSTLYTAIPFTLGVNRYTDDGTIPNLEIKVSNVTKALQPYLIAYDGMVGCDIDLYIVNKGLLAEDYSELKISFKVIGTSSDSMWVTFNLSVPNPLRQRFPLFNFISDMCNWVSYYKGPECKYAGALETCDGTFEDCEAHSNTANFGGFPGLNQSAFKIAR